MQGSIVNQVEISGFKENKDLVRFRKNLKSFKSNFNLKSYDKKFSFIAEEATWKEKDDNCLIYLFITEDSHPGEEIKQLAQENDSLTFKHLIISPADEGVVYCRILNGNDVEENIYPGDLAKMLGNLIQGGFQ